PATETLSLHDALPILVEHPRRHAAHPGRDADRPVDERARAPAPVLVARPPHARRVGAPVEVLLRELGRAPFELGVRRTATALGVGQPVEHALDPLALLRAREPRGDRDDRALAVAVGAHRALASA